MRLSCVDEAVSRGSELVHTHKEAGPMGSEAGQHDASAQVQGSGLRLHAMRWFCVRLELGSHVIRPPKEVGVHSGSATRCVPVKYR